MNRHNRILVAYLLMVGCGNRTTSSADSATDGEPAEASTSVAAETTAASVTDEGGGRGTDTGDGEDGEDGGQDGPPSEGDSTSNLTDGGSGDADTGDADSGDTSASSSTGDPNAGPCTVQSPPECAEFPVPGGEVDYAAALLAPNVLQLKQVPMSLCEADLEDAVTCGSGCGDDEVVRFTFAGPVAAGLYSPTEVLLESYALEAIDGGGCSGNESFVGGLAVEIVAVTAECVVGRFGTVLDGEFADSYGFAGAPCS